MSATQRPLADVVPIRRPPAPPPSDPPPRRGWWEPKPVTWLDQRRIARQSLADARAWLDAALDGDVDLADAVDRAQDILATAALNIDRADLR